MELKYYFSIILMLINTSILYSFIEVDSLSNTSIEVKNIVKQIINKQITLDSLDIIYMNKALSDSSFGISVFTHKHYVRQQNILNQMVNLDSVIVQYNTMTIQNSKKRGRDLSKIYHFCIVKIAYISLGKEVQVLSHELGHVFDYFQQGLDKYKDMHYEGRECSADEHDFIIQMQLGRNYKYSRFLFGH